MPTARAAPGRPAHRAVVDAYVEAEIHPWVPDAWVDHTKTKIGYEIPLTRHFYKFRQGEKVCSVGLYRTPEREAF